MLFMLCFFFFCIYYKVFLYKIINNIKYRVKKTLRHMFLAGAAYGSAGTGFLLSRVRLSASQGEPVRVHQLSRVDLLVIGQDLID